MPRYFIASRRGLLSAGGTVRLRFYAELNDHLAPARRERAFEHRLDRRASVKDVIESLGVPHTEVDAVLVNNHSVGFDAVLQDGDSVGVYPCADGLNVTPLRRLRPKASRSARFILDGHLGRLARYLRVLGFDTAYAKDAADEELASRSRRSRRILLTRDRGLLKRNEITYGAFIYATDPRRQLTEVLRRFQLHDSLRPFTRCPNCNGRLVRAAKATLENELDAALLARHARFRRCRDCGQLYWPGSHHARLQMLVDEIRSDSQAGIREV